MTRHLRLFVGSEPLSYLAAAAALGIALSAIELAFAGSLQGFLGAIGLVSPEAVALPRWFPRGLFINALILVLIGLLRTAALFWRQHAQTMVAQSFSCLQRNRIAEKSFLRPHVATMAQASSLFSDITIRAGQGLNHLLGGIVNLITAGSLFIGGLWLAPLEMISGCALFAAMLLPLKFLNRRVDDAGLGLNLEWQSLNDKLLNGIRHNFFLRVSGLLDNELGAVNKAARNYLEHYNRYSLATSIEANVPIFLGILVVAAVSCLSVYFFGTAPTILLSFFYLFLRMAQNIGATLASWADVQIQLPALKELYAWWDEAEKTAAQATAAVPLSASESEALRTAARGNGIPLAAEILSFRYGTNGPDVLSSISFSITRGDLLVVTGESGSGKSTLLALLFGVLNPSAGSLKTAGIAMTRGKEALYPFMGYAGPEPYLVAGTVRDILGYGHPAPSSLTDAELFEALKTAQALEFVQGLGGLDAHVHEAARLSTGQKQRLAIARVLARKPKLLILDEFTANLDHETESAVIEGLKPLLANMTTVIATHRPSLLALATKRIEL